MSESQKSKAKITKPTTISKAANQLEILEQTEEFTLENLQAIDCIRCNHKFGNFFKSI
jgi:hypothetical protein